MSDVVPSARVRWGLCCYVFDVVPSVLRVRYERTHCFHRCVSWKATVQCRCTLPDITWELRLLYGEGITALFLLDVEQYFFEANVVTLQVCGIRRLSVSFSVNSLSHFGLWRLST